MWNANPKRLQNYRSHDVTSHYDVCPTSYELTTNDVLQNHASKTRSDVLVARGGTTQVPQKLELLGNYRDTGLWVS